MLEERHKHLCALSVRAAHIVLARRPAAAKRAMWSWIEKASRPKKLARIAIPPGEARPGQTFLNSALHQFRLVHVLQDLRARYDG